MKPRVVRALSVAVLALMRAVPAAAVCDFGPDTCKQGFVWREAFPGDHVCVSGQTRTEAANDNAQAAQRRSPNGGPFGPDTCLPGFVWREASPADHVCVTGATRTQAAADNAQAADRRDPQCAVDTTPPAFVQVRIRFVRATDGLEVGTQIVPAGGFAATVPRDRRFVIEATAADNESRVALIRQARSYTWTCNAPEGTLGTAQSPLLDSRSDEEVAGTNPAAPTLLQNAHFTEDPFSGSASRRVCSCAMDSTALTAAVTLSATNGAGLVGSFGPIVVTYPPQAACPRALGAWCGDKARGPLVACVTGTTCGVKQSKVCDGWFIFRHCDYIQTTDMFCQ